MLFPKPKRYIIITITILLGLACGIQIASSHNPPERPSTIEMMAADAAAPTRPGRRRVSIRFSRPTYLIKNPFRWLQESHPIAPIRCAKIGPQCVQFPPGAPKEHRIGIRVYCSIVRFKFGFHDGGGGGKHNYDNDDDDVDVDVHFHTHQEHYRKGPNLNKPNYRVYPTVINPCPKGARCTLTIDKDNKSCNGTLPSPSKDSSDDVASLSSSSSSSPPLTADDDTWLWVENDDGIIPGMLDLEEEEEDGEEEEEKEDIEKGDDIDTDAEYEDDFGTPIAIGPLIREVRYDTDADDDYEYYNDEDYDDYHDSDVDEGQEEEEEEDEYVNVEYGEEYGEDLGGYDDDDAYDDYVLDPDYYIVDNGDGDGNGNGNGANDDDEYDFGHQLLIYTVPDEQSYLAREQANAALDDGKNGDGNNSLGITSEKDKKKKKKKWYHFACVVDDDDLGDQDN